MVLWPAGAMVTRKLDRTGIRADPADHSVNTVSEDLRPVARAAGVESDVLDVAAICIHLSARAVVRVHSIMTIECKAPLHIP